jgi:hypothetical protein
MVSARVAVVLLALGSWACTSPGGGTSPDAGVALDFVGRSCNVDAECGELRCDKVRRQCICLSDESCRSADPDAPLRYCNNYTGLCVTEIAGCTSDAQCDVVEFCDSSTRTCRARKTFCAPCTADNQCGGEGDLCLLEQSLGQTFCGKACATAADCPRGASCQQLGGALQCWPAPNPLTPNEPSTCAAFKGCTPDSLQPCDTNADCGGGFDQRCDQASGRCVALVQACPFGTVCDPRNRICVAECAADADCGDAALRCVNRVCEPVSDCDSDANCPANKVCSVAPGATSGQCVSPCQSTQECPLGQVCAAGTDGRHRCQPGCTSNLNCPLDQRCDTQKQACEGPVVGSTRTCQATVACNTCELCDGAASECTDARLQFPYCAPCLSSSQCPGGTCVLMDDGLSYCARFCGSGQECPQGFACLAIGGGAQSACVPADRRCENKCS